MDVSRAWGAEAGIRSAEVVWPGHREGVQVHSERLGLTARAGGSAGAAIGELELVGPIGDDARRQHAVPAHRLRPGAIEAHRHGAGRRLPEASSTFTLAVPALRALR